VLQASMEPPPAEPEHPFLVVTPAGHLEAGPTAPGRVFGPFRSMRELRGRMKAAEGLPLEEAITRITRGIGPLGLLRRAGPPPGPGHLVRQGERLLWIQHDRLRKAWTIGADDESQIRDEIRSLLERPFDPATAPRVRAKRGTPVEDFLR
jgi:hypothetical protein